MKFLAKGFFIFACLVILCTEAFAITTEAQDKILKKFDKETILNAIEKYDKMVAQSPKSEDGYINRAYLNYLLGNLDSAIADYNQLILINPKNEEFFLNRGYLKHINNQREEALKDYNEAIKLKPNYAFAYNNRGVVLAELGKPEESMNAYDAAIKIDPNYADAYYNRGSLKTRTEKNDDALKDFDTAIKLNPKDSASYNNRGVVKRKLNCNVGALSDFTIAIKLNPEDIIAYTNRGHLKKRFFDSKGAEEDFQTAINVAEGSPLLIREIELESHMSAVMPTKAVETTPIAYTDAPADLNKALRMPKVSKETMQRLADRRVSINGDNIKAASGAIQASVVKVDPKKNTKLAQTTPVKPTPAKSAPQITTKPVQNPDLAECYYIRALQKYILQNRDSALADLNKAIEYNPKYADAYYYRAAIKRDLKDESFVDDYKTAIQINPNLKSVDDANVLMVLK